MTLGISIPSPTTRGSPSSDESSQLHTPVSPSFPGSSQRSSSNSNTTESTLGTINGNKRKSTRRVNTAERRATHNAVERARRENLNGRFLDLAALLPNLSQIRRPSKSAIVNSSIAHIHASRRHRMLASRELRILKLESDALRRELNEWRDRAGIPRVHEPPRGDAFSMILSGEMEVLPIPNADEEEGEYVYGDEEGAGVVYATGSPDDFGAMNAPPPRSSNARPDISRRSPSNGYDVPMEQQMLRHTGGPIVASPGGMVVENPTMGMMYNISMGNGPYTVAFAPDMEQNKWGPDTNVNEQGLMASVSRRSSLATSDVRGNRDRAMSTSTTSSSGSGSPAHTYYDPGWNATLGGMAPNMGANMGMMSGSANGNMANRGATFAPVM
ncbi:hypothetical protein J3R30DRAFT_618687 [Lentinula aciculospora]|uniref:BHLH domain-containing protein n=1 Tax=Lentinula aciculospora TaxID=153920 RepID=A0A9W9DKL2_9AGAR|nr:hypothetical protein J3R30DRAFT_618687 [Lentinula aciculospora]